jgi:hypothetical protein
MSQINFLEFYNVHKLLEGGLLTEDNRKELLSKVDPNFIHHAENTKKLPELSPTGAVYKRLNLFKDKGKDELEIWFETRGATTDNHPWWLQRIIVKNLLEQLKTAENLDRTIRDALERNDLLLGCTCGSAQFYYNYTMTKKNVIHPRFRETRSAPVNNPNNKGICCKHLALVLSVISANTYKMVSDAKKIIPELSRPKTQPIQKPFEKKIQNVDVKDKKI